MLGETDPALADVFDATPAAEVWRRDVDFACESRTGSPSAVACSTSARPGASYDEVFLSLHGAHQGENAAVAVAAAEAFFGRPLDPDLVARGASRSVRNPGRFEVVQRDPLLILDGAHNRDGAIAAAEALAEGFAVTGVTHLVIGVLDGRDPAELLDILDAEDAATVVCCTPDSPRALPARGARRARPPRAAVGPSSSTTSATRSTRARPRAEPDDIVLVTGSLYTVGERAPCRARSTAADARVGRSVASRS